MVEQFIARKADILFEPSWRSAVPVEVELDEEAEGKPFMSCQVQAGEKESE